MYGENVTKYLLFFFFFPKMKAKSGGFVLDVIVPFELVKDENRWCYKKE